MSRGTEAIPPTITWQRQARRGLEEGDSPMVKAAATDFTPHSRNVSNDEDADDPFVRLGGVGESVEEFEKRHPPSDGYQLQALWTVLPGTEAVADLADAELRVHRPGILWRADVDVDAGPADSGSAWASAAATAAKNKIKPSPTTEVDAPSNDAQPSNTPDAPTPGVPRGLSHAYLAQPCSMWSRHDGLRRYEVRVCPPVVPAAVAAGGVSAAAAATSIPVAGRPPVSTAHGDNTRHTSVHPELMALLEQQAVTLSRSRPVGAGVCVGEDSRAVDALGRTVNPHTKLAAELAAVSFLRAYLGGSMANRLLPPRPMAFWLEGAPLRLQTSPGGGGGAGSDVEAAARLFWSIDRDANPLPGFEWVMSVASAPEHEAKKMRAQELVGPSDITEPMVRTLAEAWDDLSIQKLERLVMDVIDFDVAVWKAGAAAGLKGVGSLQERTIVRDPSGVHIKPEPDSEDGRESNSGRGSYPGQSDRQNEAGRRSSSTSGSRQKPITVRYFNTGPLIHPEFFAGSHAALTDPTAPADSTAIPGFAGKISTGPFRDGRSWLEARITMAEYDCAEVLRGWRLGYDDRPPLTDENTLPVPPSITAARETFDMLHQLRLLLPYVSPPRLSPSEVWGTTGGGQYAEADAGDMASLFGETTSGSIGGRGAFREETPGPTTSTQPMGRPSARPTPRPPAPEPATLRHPLTARDVLVDPLTGALVGIVGWWSDGPGPTPGAGGRDHSLRPGHGQHCQSRPQPEEEPPKTLKRKRGRPRKNPTPPPPPVVKFVSPAEGQKLPPPPPYPVPVCNLATTVLPLPMAARLPAFLAGPHRPFAPVEGRHNLDKATGKLLPHYWRDLRNHNLTKLRVGYVREMRRRFALLAGEMILARSRGGGSTNNGGNAQQQQRDQWRRQRPESASVSGSPAAPSTVGSMAAAFAYSPTPQSGPTATASPSAAAASSLTTRDWPAHYSASKGLRDLELGVALLSGMAGALGGIAEGRRARDAAERVQREVAARPAQRENRGRWAQVEARARGRRLRREVDTEAEEEDEEPGRLDDESVVEDTQTTVGEQVDGDQVESEHLDDNLAGDGQVVGAQADGESEHGEQREEENGEGQQQEGRVGTGVSGGEEDTVTTNDGENSVKEAATARNEGENDGQGESAANGDKGDGDEPAHNEDNDKGDNDNSEDEDQDHNNGTSERVHSEDRDGARGNGEGETVDSDDEACRGGSSTIGRNSEGGPAEDEDQDLSTTSDLDVDVDMSAASDPDWPTSSSSGSDTPPPAIRRRRRTSGPARRRRGGRGRARRRRTSSTDSLVSSSDDNDRSQLPDPVSAWEEETEAHGRWVAAQEAAQPQLMRDGELRRLVRAWAADVAAGGLGRANNWGGVDETRSLAQLAQMDRPNGLAERVNDWIEKEGVHMDYVI